LNRHDRSNHLAQTAIEVFGTPIADDKVRVLIAFREGVVASMSRDRLIGCSVLESVVEAVVDWDIIVYLACWHRGGAWYWAVGRERRIEEIVPWHGNIKIEWFESTGRDESEEFAVGFIQLEGVILVCRPIKSD